MQNPLVETSGDELLIDRQDGVDLPGYEEDRTARLYGKAAGWYPVTHCRLIVLSR